MVDYKTGVAPEDAAAVHESEARQLRLYAHLAAAAGIQVKRGVIVRPDGRRTTLPITGDEAKAEADRARQILATLNAAAERRFEEVAEPSAQACRYCPCIPFCEPFWRNASGDWANELGLHIEGRITNVARGVAQNMLLLTLGMLVTRGTVATGPAVVEQVPESWAVADGDAIPKAGDLVRITHCRLPEKQQGSPIIRADRLASAIWTVV